MGSVLIEKNDALQAKKAIFNAATLDALLKSEAPEQLMAVADQQIKRMAA